MTSTTYQNSDENNDAINALKADYDTRLQALRDGSGGTSGFQSAASRGRKFFRNNPVLAIGGALTVGLLVGAFVGRRSIRGSSNGGGRGGGK